MLLRPRFSPVAALVPPAGPIDTVAGLPPPRCPGGVTELRLRFYRAEWQRGCPTYPARTVAFSLGFRLDDAGALASCHYVSERFPGQTAPNAAGPPRGDLRDSSDVCMSAGNRWVISK